MRTRNHTSLLICVALLSSLLIAGCGGSTEVDKKEVESNRSRYEQKAMERGMRREGGAPNAQGSGTTGAPR